MYKIGQFSIITGLTVKALRHYHKESLLIPSKVENITGYRMYDKTQIIEARKIKILRDCGFSIKEIKDIFSHSDDLEDIPYYIEEKLASLVKQEMKIRNIKKSLLEETLEKRGVIMSEYQVYEKTAEEELVISTNYVGKYEDCGKYMGTLYKLAKQHSHKKPLNLYFDAEYKEDASIEVCVPVKKKIKVSGEVNLKTLKETKGLATIHIGPYDKVGDAYQAISDYANKLGIELDIPSRETYLKGPGMFFMGNPNKYRTELFIPIKE
ncbi:hypothetical protein CI105_08280 [Candidatus Izimaplasma bacterium ZiA1]|uniref:MerR family transcriptional regulator n=1 Tax=Candidatus Izimoplasma sp. ZiA1 TaxID=2024899 RepID=UPI000BAA790B|nr:hypothetical protein CI105_08280 [Candidatus Izimaplasma bacterium ZiA1]